MLGTVHPELAHGERGVEQRAMVRPLPAGVCIGSEETAAEAHPGPHEPLPLQRGDEAQERPEQNLLLLPAELPEGFPYGPGPAGELPGDAPAGPGEPQRDVAAILRPLLAHEQPLPLQGIHRPAHGRRGESELASELPDPSQLDRPVEEVDEKAGLYRAQAPPPGLLAQQGLQSLREALQRVGELALYLIPAQKLPSLAYGWLQSVTCNTTALNHA